MTARPISSGLAPWPQRHRGGLAVELLLGLARVGQRGAGADAVHPDARRQGQRHALGQRPQPGLGHRVGHEMRRQRPDPLVEHVDDRALRRYREAAGEMLHQHEGRAQVGLEMRVPGGAGGVVPLVALEAAGVVDQHADRAERRGWPGAAGRWSGFPAPGRPAAARRGGPGRRCRRRSRHRRRGWRGSARRRRSRPPPGPGQWHGRSAGRRR